MDREWTISEREKLLDAVSKVAPDDYASISDIVGNTKTPAEVKDYLKRIQIRWAEGCLTVEMMPLPDARWRLDHHGQSDYGN